MRCSVGTMEFLRFAGDAGLDWGAGEQEYWSTIVDALSAAAAGLNFRMPQVHRVKTSGTEEFYAVYSRHQSIVLPAGRLAIAGDVRRDFFLLTHELFHALSSVELLVRALSGHDRLLRCRSDLPVPTMWQTGGKSAAFAQAVPG